MGDKNIRHFLTKQKDNSNIQENIINHFTLSTQVNGILVSLVVIIQLMHSYEANIRICQS